MNRIAVPVALLTCFSLATSCGETDRRSSPPSESVAARPAAEPGNVGPRLRVTEDIGWAAFLLAIREGERDPIGAAIRFHDPSDNGVTSWYCSMPGPPRGAYVLAGDVDANVFVTSRGAKDGVQVGETYSVWRDGLLKARIKITDVRDGQSVGRALGKVPAGGIRNGDRVDGPAQARDNSLPR